MITDDMLMKTLIRTGAQMRRRPAPEEGVPAEDRHCPGPDGRDSRRGSGGRDGRHGPGGRGFGHILELLTPGEGVSQQWIANQVGIRAQSVSEAIVAMEKRGFVRREASQTDRRVMLIYMTEEGEAHRQKAAAERSRHAQAFFSVLTQEEKEELFRMLQKLISVASERPAVPQDEQEVL